MPILRSVLIVAVVLLGLLLIMAVAYQRYSDKRTQARYPLPGKMVDVGGYQLHFDCRGTGEVTVLLEAGAGGFSAGWARVQDDLVKTGRVKVCSYDRAGLGWSETAPGAYRIDDEVNALHHGLGNLGIQEKLILVGHSYGGFLAHRYASKFPNQVQGIILVDPNTISYFDKNPGVTTLSRGLGYVLDVAASLGLARWVIAKPLRSITLLARREDVERLVELTLTTDSLKAQARMMKAFPATIATLRETKMPMSIPLTLISRGQDDAGWYGKKRENDWREGHRELVQSLKHGKLVVAHGSDHMIPYKQPAIIINSVIDLLNGS